MQTMRKWWLDEYPEPLYISLTRDGFSTPWGFRIAGGLDYGQTPIVVSQVLACSPADGQMAIGDVIISVDHQQVFRRRHFDVLSMLSREAGGTLELQLYRGPVAEQIKARSGFNVRFHAPLSYFPVTSTPLTQQQEPVERPNAMYRTVYNNQTGRPTTISLRRQNPHEVQHQAPPSRSVKQHYFNPQQDEYMLQKVQQSLDALTMGRSSRLEDYGDRNDPDYNYIPLSDKRRLFNQGDGTSPGSYLQGPQRQQQQHKPRVTYDYSRPARAHSVGPGQRGIRVTPSSYSAFIRPRSSMGQPVPGHSRVPEFCWMPRGFKPKRGGSQPTRMPSNASLSQSHHQFYQPQEDQYHYPTPQPVEVLSPASARVYTQQDDERDKNYVPPWKGTLHSASPSAWIEGQLIDPNNPLYHREHKRREPPASAEPVQIIETKEADDGRKVVHLQYNSPLQLYSKDAAKNTLEEQTASLGGPEGTIMIKGGRPGAPPQKITESSVYRMVHEEDLRRQRRLQRANNAGQPRNSSSSRQQHGQTPTATASASGQLKVVLQQPPQHSHRNYFSSGDDAPLTTSGFSDF